MPVQHCVYVLLQTNKLAFTLSSDVYGDSEHYADHEPLHSK